MVKTKFSEFPRKVSINQRKINLNYLDKILIFKKKKTDVLHIFYRMLNSGKKFKKRMQHHSVKLLQL